MKEIFIVSYIPLGNQQKVSPHGVIIVSWPTSAKNILHEPNWIREMGRCRNRKYMSLNRCTRSTVAGLISIYSRLGCLGNCIPTGPGLSILGL